MSPKWRVQRVPRSRPCGTKATLAQMLDANNVFVAARIVGDHRQPPEAKSLIERRRLEAVRRQYHLTASSTNRFSLRGFHQTGSEPRATHRFVDPQTSDD